MCSYQSDRPITEILNFPPAELDIVRSVLAKTFLSLGPVLEEPMPWDQAHHLALSVLRGENAKYVVSVTFRQYVHHISVKAWIVESTSRVGVVETATRETALLPGDVSGTLEVALLTAPDMTIRFLSPYAQERA